MRCIVIGAVVLFSACGPGFDAPDDDTCDSPGSVTLSSLQLGGSDEDSFAPLTNGAVVQLAEGGQGGHMLGVRFRLEGADIPECVSHSTIVTTPDGAFDLANYSSPLRTYPAGDGAAETHTLWLILDGATPMSGATLFVDTTVAGTAMSMSLWVDAVGADAAPPPGVFGDSCQCPGLNQNLCQGPCETDLSCVVDVCSSECFGPSDTSCPQGTECAGANASGDFLGFYCLTP